MVHVSAWVDCAADLPPGARVYAIGDVHGQADRLRRLHAAIAADLAARPVDRAVVVQLGDLIDRGPDSARVLDMLARSDLPPESPLVLLRGNHEQMALDALDGRGDPAVWLANGGRETLRSWGCAGDAVPPLSALPPAHMALLRGTVLHHQVGNCLFVHAGVRPGIPLAQQMPHDLMWVREPFLSWPGPWGADLPAVVVHGHTPKAGVVLRPNRIGVDTGAGVGGPLSAVTLETGPQHGRVRVLTA